MTYRFSDDRFQSLHCESFEYLPYRGDVLPHNPVYTPVTAQGSELDCEQTISGTVFVQDTFTQDRFVFDDDKLDTSDASVSYPGGPTACWIKDNFEVGEAEAQNPSYRHLVVPDTTLDVGDAQQNDLMLQIGEYLTKIASGHGQTEQPAPRRRHATRNPKQVLSIQITPNLEAVFNKHPFLDG